MAWSVINTVTAGSTNGGTSVTTAATDMSSGGPADTLIIAVASDGVFQATPSDSINGNTYTPLTEAHTGGTVGIQLWYLKNASVTTTMTFSASTANSFCAIAVLGAKGGDLSAPLDAGSDQTRSAAGWSTLALASSFTPGSANELLVSAVAFDVASVPTISDTTANNTFGSVVTTNLSGGQHYGVGLAYVVQTSALAVNPQWAVTLNSGSIALATFKIAAAGGSNWGPFLLSQDWNRLVRS